jgi:hypothetical protein
MAYPGYVAFTAYPYPNGKQTLPQSMRLNGLAVPTAAKTVVAVTAWSITSNVITFTATNTLAAGNMVLLSGFATGTFLNGQYVTVIATGLSGSQFEAQFAQPVGFGTSATENGNAILLSAGPLATVPITAWSITSNVVTFTAVNTLATGNVVYLSGFPTSTFFNGQAVTVLSTGLSGTQFEANFTHANGSATEAGVATIYPTYSTDGLPCVWFPQMNSVTGNTEYPIAGLSPAGGPALPLTASVRFITTVAGEYDYCYDPVHNTLRAVTSSAEVTSGTQLAADTIQYTAEFSPNWP